MHNFQSFIKSTRESKELKRDTIADAINLSEDTIKIIEEADNDTLLQSSCGLLKNQIRRYCEYLEVSEKKIVSILNKVDILYYKKSRYGKLKFFDYINRLAIIIIIIAIAILVTKEVKEKINTASSEPQISKSSIIYTPIEYDKNSYGEQQTTQAPDNNTVNQSDSTKHITSTKALDSGSTITNSQSSKSDESSPSSHSSTLTAHPPATANMSNMVIDAPSPSASSIKISTKQ
ncbi:MULTISPECIES: helix-turn-helix domain-containing protein [unclassified Francisella]|uniref:helix-turn-helix domain-containing protein n=1 Tax=unclassified Francisella TaxID=2610885 RepID=UPI002E2EC94B|nr:MULTISPECIES: helix-turn-helix domain-containing protein [unclassified Francisella]MED7819773.1 helix-turn-helix domain-containing protein [Francisella sp. 19S2-4]MED7830593.1 helix-turn-helix domain-containing protein [Francisella sp. 19S2-10]